ncbi:MAG: TonB-dependent receptor [Gammaproteobacteria bacterium]|nr:TonB-dependent receptor [Gammaproteobacteria bacterium]
MTARKREESLFEVPVAVTAFGAQQIADLQLTGIADVARFTPGLSFNAAFGRQDDRPVVRGVGNILNGIAGISSASTFVDGVFVGGSVASTELHNVERVEIIKGPQAAQYGRGTYAGAINYVTRRPTDQLEGELRVGFAQHQTREISAWVSGPVAPGLAYFYLAGGYDEYGGEYRNTLTGLKVGEEESRSVTGRLLFTPSDNLDISVKLGYQEQDDGHPPLVLTPRTINNCCFRTADAPRAREYYVGTAPTYNEVTLATALFDDLGGAGLRRERLLASFSLDWELASGATVSAVTGLVDDKNRSNLDISYAGYDPLFNPALPPFLQEILSGGFFSSREFKQQDLSQELRFSSPVDQPVRWSVGAYWYDGERVDTRNDKIIPANTGAIGNETDLVRNNGPFRVEDIENRAVFGGVEFDVTDRLTLSAEARWARDDVTLGNRSPVTGAMLEEFSETFTSFTPRITAVFQLNDDWNLYGNLARGTRPGTFNPQVPVGPDGEPDESLRAVDEESSVSLEIGSKARILDGRGSLIAAAYFTRLTDQQSSEIIVLPTGATAATLRNVGRSEIRGFEVELGLQPLDGWVLNASYSFTDAEIKRELSVDQADLLGSTGTFEDIQRFGSVAGQRPGRVPKHQAALATRYSRALSTNSQWEWFIGGDVTHEGSRFAAEHNLIETGSNTYVGLQLGVESEQWRVMAWAKNLFDDDTVVDIFRFIDNRFGRLPAQPEAVVQGSTSPRGFAVTLPRGRQVGVTATYRF